MYNLLLQSHSLLRYFVLIMLLIVIVRALLGLLNKEPFGKWDNKSSLYLLIFTHLQALTGLILYIISPAVQFSSETMRNSTLRYWAVEHIVAMLIAVVLITVGRVTSKRMISDYGKHKRLFFYNAIAFLIVVGIILMSDRRLV